MPLPPDVIDIRWNSWLIAAFYYEEKISLIKSFVLALKDDDATSVKNSKETINDEKLQRALHSIRRYYFLTEAINKLEKRGMTVIEQLAILSSVKCKLSDVESTKMERVWKQLNVIRYNNFIEDDTDSTFYIFYHACVYRTHDL